MSEKISISSLAADIKMIGWFPTAGSVISVGIGFIIAALISKNSGSASLSSRVVDTIIPVFFGLQAAFLFSPETEPALEILVSCRSPLSRILWKRFLLFFCLQGAVAFFFNLASSAFIPDDPGLASEVAKWIPACVFIGGTAIYTTILTRQGVFGALLALLMWAGMLFGMDRLLHRFPFLWPIHVYLQSDQISTPGYLINRLSLTVIGLFLIFLASRLTDNEERMLGLNGGSM